MHYNLAGVAHYDIAGKDALAPDAHDPVRLRYALFLMNDQTLQYLDRSDGWEIGVGPSIVVLDKGKGKSVTSTTLTKDVYAFIFNQKGLMAGVGIQGSKITKVSQ